MPLEMHALNANEIAIYDKALFDLRGEYWHQIVDK